MKDAIRRPVLKILFALLLTLSFQLQAKKFSFTYDPPVSWQPGAEQMLLSQASLPNLIRHFFTAIILLVSVAQNCFLKMCLSRQS